MGLSRTGVPGAPRERRMGSSGTGAPRAPGGTRVGTPGTGPPGATGESFANYLMIGISHFWLVLDCFQIYLAFCRPIIQSSFVLFPFAFLLCHPTVISGCSHNSLILYCIILSRSIGVPLIFRFLATGKFTVFTLPDRELILSEDDEVMSMLKRPSSCSTPT